MSGTNFICSLQSPFTMCISGMTKSGKSTLTGEILRRRNEIIQTPDGKTIDRVVYCYTEDQPKFFASLKAAIPCIEFNQGLPDDYSDGTDQNSLVVLDDLMSEASKSKDASMAFTRTSHHRNVSIIILVQSFFHKNIRTITTNCAYLILTKNPRDSSFLACLGRQMNGGRNHEQLNTAYKQCMKIPYGYVFIDLTQEQNDLYRIRDSVFPENCTVFSAK